MSDAGWRRLTNTEKKVDEVETMKSRENSIFVTKSTFLLAGEFQTHADNKNALL